MRAFVLYRRTPACGEWTAARSSTRFAATGVSFPSNSALARSKRLRDYRSFARPRQLNLHETDARMLLREAIAPHASSYQAAGIKIEFDLEKNLPPVLADSEKMKQVILNLCKNSVEAMPGGGILTCR